MDLMGEISKMAYELYEKSGYQHGRDLENWLNAEKILAERKAQAGKMSVRKIETPKTVEKAGKIEKPKVAAKTVAKKTTSRL